MSRELDFGRVTPGVVLATATVAVIALAAVLARVGSDAQLLAAAALWILARDARDATTVLYQRPAA